MSRNGRLLVLAQSKQPSSEPKHKGSPDAVGLVLGRLATLVSLELDFVGPGGSLVGIRMIVGASDAKVGLLLRAVFRVIAGPIAAAGGRRLGSRCRAGGALADLGAVTALVGPLATTQLLACILFFLGLFLLLEFAAGLTDLLLVGSGVDLAA